MAAGARLEIQTEAARQAVSLDVSSQDIEKRAKQLLQSRGIDNPTITISPSDITTVSGGDPVTVTVSVLTSSQTLLPKVVYGQRTISAQTSFVKE